MGNHFSQRLQGRADLLRTYRQRRTEAYHVSVFAFGQENEAPVEHVSNHTKRELGRRPAVFMPELQTTQQPKSARG